MFTRLHGTDVLCCPKHLEFEMRVTCSCVEDVRCGACMSGAVDPVTGRPTPAADDVREALIDAMINVETPGGYVEFAEDDREDAGYLADAVLAAPGIEVRPRGTVTDTEVKAAERVLTGAADGDPWVEFEPSVVRAALEAARKARS